MSKYRILEKKGKYETSTLVNMIVDSKIQPETYEVQLYTPRFIVQGGRIPYTPRNPLDNRWVDLKEFSSLEDAKQYKRDLELDDGIVVG